MHSSSGRWLFRPPTKIAVLSSLVSCIFVFGACNERRQPTSALNASSKDSSKPPKAPDANRAAPTQPENPRPKSSSPAKAAVPAKAAGDAPLAGQLESVGATVKLVDGAIRELTFRDTPASDQAAALAIQAKRLTKLAIYNSDLTATGWETLSELGTLEHLDLRGCKIDNASLKTLASEMPRLRSLRLFGKGGKTEVDDDGLGFLATCPDLKVLAVDHLWVSVDTLAVLPSGILELYAAKTLVDDEALEVIARKLPNLKKLRSAGNSISDTGLENLAALPLEELDLSECQQFSDAGLESIGKIKTLKKLNLWRTPTTDAGIGHLTSLVNLLWLNLDNIALSDSGLESLTAMKQLNFLHLGSTQVTDAGMKHLVELDALNDLRVTRTAVTEDGVQQIRDANPDIKIQLKYIEGQ
ncbi:MAG TPA: hypothetical protein DDW52_11295 [Planctomycetaceae bacterium]|nr:hypothetical protein [Planctomycetaceae bacterium]